LSAVAEPLAVARRIPTLMIIGLGFMAGTVVLLAVALADADRPTAAVVWGGVALAAWCAGLMCVTGGPLYRDLGLARWKAGPWILLWCALTSGLATATWDQSQASQITLPAVLRALWLVAVAMTVLTAGYLAGPGTLIERLAARRMAALSAQRLPQVRSQATPWLLFAAGLAAQVAGALWTGTLGYAGVSAATVSSPSAYAQVLALLALLAPLGVAGAALQAFGEKLPGARATLAVLFCSDIAAGAVTGFKSQFVVAVLAVIIPVAAARQRLPKRAILVAVAVFLVVVIPFTGAYRAAARDGAQVLTPAQAAARAPAILRGEAATGFASAVPASADYLLQRVQEIDSPAIVMQRTPSQIPFASPAQIAETVAEALVPRVLWPGKPAIAPGYDFSQQYYGLPASAITSAAITPEGDLWRYGGWLPVTIGMFLLGCLVRLLDDVTDIRTSPHAVFLLLLIFPVLVKNEEDVVSLLLAVASSLAVWLLAVAVAFAPRSPSQAQRRQAAAARIQWRGDRERHPRR